MLQAQAASREKRIVKDRMHDQRSMDSEHHKNVADM